MSEQSSDKITRVKIESLINSIADDCAFTMPFWLAGMLINEVRRQKLSRVKYDGDDFCVTVVIKKSPMKRPGAAGAQTQGDARDVASRQPMIKDTSRKVPETDKSNQRPPPAAIASQRKET